MKCIILWVALPFSEGKSVNFRADGRMDGKSEKRAGRRLQRLEFDNKVYYFGISWDTPFVLMGSFQLKKASGPY